MLHELKQESQYYNPVRDGVKTFEIRRNDRNFKIDDIIILREWSPFGGYRGRYLLRKITYVLHGNYGLLEGFCCLSIRPLTKEEEANHAAGIIEQTSQDIPAISQ